jgi:hypothetical protein
MMVALNEVTAKRSSLTVCLQISYPLYAQPLLRSCLLNIL